MFLSELISSSSSSLAFNREEPELNGNEEACIKNQIRNGPPNLDKSLHRRESWRNAIFFILNQTYYGNIYGVTIMHCLHTRFCSMYIATSALIFIMGLNIHLSEEVIILTISQSPQRLLRRVRENIEGVSRQCNSILPKWCRSNSFVIARVHSKLDEWKHIFSIGHIS
jgi:hypothetical protein